MSLAAIRHGSRVWRQLLVQAFTMSLIYRAQAAIWMIAGVMPLAMMMIWMELAKAGPMAGYGRDDFALYFMGMFLVRQLTPIWCILLLDRGIRKGELSPLLLRPMPPIWQHVAEHLGELLVRLPVILVVFVLGLWLTDVITRLDPWHLPLLILALAGAWTIFFLLHYCVGLLAFWIDGALALEPLLWYLYVILGGSIVPLDLFPPAIGAILHWLPFAYILDFPVQIMMGRLDAGGMLQGFILQYGWVLILVVIRQLVWQAGLKRFSAAGA